jgi:tight adherence protein C
MNGISALPAALMVGGAVLLLTIGAALLWLDARDNDIAERIRAVAHGEANQQKASTSLGMVRLLLSMVRKLGDRMRNTALMSPKDVAEFEKMLASAGLNARSTLGVLIGAKFLTPLVLAVPAYLIGRMQGWSGMNDILLCAGTLPAGMLLPNWAMGFLQGRYRTALERGVPDALDLIVICAEAGLGLETAIERVAIEMRASNPAVAFEFSLLDQEMRLLSDRRRAIANFADRASVAAMRRIASTIIQTIEYGTPLGRGLRTLAAEMRQERLTQLEEQAAKLPSLLVLPMILFILPSLFVVILGPAIIRIMDIFGHMK